MESRSSSEFTVPENVFERLLAAANSSSLEEALELLTETSRTYYGRSDLASMHVLPTVLQLSRFLSSSSSSSARYLLFSSLRLLRNLCAGEISNQNSFVRENGIEVVAMAFESVGLGFDSDYSIVRAGLQVLGNVSLAGEEHRSAVWNWHFPVGFLQIARIRMVEVSDPLCMIIYTCSKGNHERIGELSGVRGLHILAEIVRTASTVGFHEDWFKLLLSSICFEESHFPQLFSELSLLDIGNNGCNVKCGDNHFTMEQAFLLSTLGECLNKKLAEISVSNDFALCVLGILKRAVGILDWVSKAKSGFPTGSAAIDVLGYSLTILRDICAQDEMRSSEKDNSADVLLASGLIELMLDLLRDLGPPVIIKKSMSSENGEGYISSNLLKLCPYKGFRRDIVGVIGNCSYRKKHVQDKIRQKNGILLLLQQCVIDEENPFLREWGIWTMRSLLEGNIENQREVAQLEVQGSVDVPEFAALGLRVEVDPRTGRAKLVNVAAAEKIPGD
ncbi:hypothetical protein NE237_027486 [Protea cynaroides]|uniref:Ataxin-10 domain-containing protein n=1 Tax=Protea cynaroides TaxID=273540 RepID=A0A9Q0GNM8_9MAGN|nr:hypothetical protein NE237_027486 [Protea cynaroides]